MDVDTFKNFVVTMDRDTRGEGDESEDEVELANSLANLASIRHNYFMNVCVHHVRRHKCVLVTGAVSFLSFFFLFYFASSHVGVITILQERPRACQERSVRGEAVHGIVLEEAGDFNSHPQLRWKACVFIIKGRDIYDIYGNR